MKTTAKVRLFLFLYILFFNGFFNNQILFEREITEKK